MTAAVVLMLCRWLLSLGTDRKIDAVDHDRAFAQRVGTASWRIECREVVSRPFARSFSRFRVRTRSSWIARHAWGMIAADSVMPQEEGACSVRSVHGEHREMTDEVGCGSDEFLHPSM